MAGNGKSRKEFLKDECSDVVRCTVFWFSMPYLFRFLAFYGLLQTCHVNHLPNTRIFPLYSQLHLAESTILLQTKIIKLQFALFPPLEELQSAGRTNGCKLFIFFYEKVDLIFSQRAFFLLFFCYYRKYVAGTK